MTSARLTVAALALPLIVSGCGSTPTAGPTPSPAPPTSAGQARNLSLAPGVVHQLVVAAAAVKRVPASGFSGLEPALRYYAYDRPTRTWWAAAALRAKNPDAGGAAVSLNDAGSYDVFHRTVGGHWVVRESGGAGGPELPLRLCSDWPPRRVLRLWHWSLTVCVAPH